MSHTPGTVIITGPTGGLGHALTLHLAHLDVAERPDLVLIGRPGDKLDAVTGEVRALGATVLEIGCDFARLADIHDAASAVRKAVTDGAVRPIAAVAANAGVMSMDTTKTSVDGYELTMAVNYLAPAAFIHDISDLLNDGARVVLLGSNTYWQNIFRKLMHVAPAKWRDLKTMAAPASSQVKPSADAAGVAYSNSKLALMYYAHELQRHLGDRANVIVFEPGFMPGSGLSRGAGEAAARIGRAISRLPRVSTPEGSAPFFADVLIGPKWADARNGAFVLKDQEIPVKAFAKDDEREKELWQATSDMLGW